MVFHPTYFPNIAHFVAMIQAEQVIFEAEDNFQKQTYRNRCYIYAANGKLQLNIPVVNSQKNRQKYAEVQIANTYKWQDLHWKSLQSAYRTSPFFEFYADELEPLFTEEASSIYDFNLKCFEILCDCMQLDLNIAKTEAFHKSYQDQKDYRFLVDAKKELDVKFDPYTQVFGSKHGFINNLSILDLLFNEGPNTLSYLESQKRP